MSDRRSTPSTELHNRRKQASESYRIIDRPTLLPTKNKPGTYIEMIAYEGRNHIVVRYIPLDLSNKFEHFEAGKDSDSTVLLNIMDHAMDELPDTKTWSACRSGRQGHSFV